MITVTKDSSAIFSLVSSQAYKCTPVGFIKLPFPKHAHLGHNTEKKTRQAQEPGNPPQAVTGSQRQGSPGKSPICRVALPYGAIQLINNPSPNSQWLLSTPTAPETCTVMLADEKQIEKIKFFKRSIYKAKLNS